MRMQTDVGEMLVTVGKDVVLVVRHEDERQAVTRLLEEMGVTVQHAETGQDAIMLIEDSAADFMVMDVQLVDMHAWKMLGVLKEIVDLSQLPTIVLMDEPSVVPLDNVTSVVRPVSMPKLRQIFVGWLSTS